MLIEVGDRFYKVVFVFFFKQKTAYEMRISDWSSDVCSSDLGVGTLWRGGKFHALRRRSGPSAGRLSRHVRISRRGGEASPREGPAMVRRYRPGARRRPIIRISANPLARHTSSHMIALTKSEGEALCARLN